jgi:hypothetical protein
MGSGKGAPEYWVARVKPGRIMFEIDGVNQDIAREVEQVSATEDATIVADLADAAPIVRFVNLVLQQAVQDRASDIHFEPFENEFRIRYRVDGALYEMSPPPKHLAIPVVSRIKVMSNLNIAERRMPQDGRIELNVGGNPVDMRVSILPTLFGESVVIRVLDRTVVSLDLDKIGMPQFMLTEFRRLIQKPNGIMLVTEGCFSMDADSPDLAALHALAQAYQALLVVDVAHDLGALGPGGQAGAVAGAPGGHAGVLVQALGLATAAAGAAAGPDRRPGGQLALGAAEALTCGAGLPVAAGAGRSARRGGALRHARPCRAWPLRAVAGAGAVHRLAGTAP